MPLGFSTTPTRAAAIFATTAVAWIFAGDMILLGFLPDDPVLLTWAQFAKAIAFILVTACLIYLILDRAEARWRAAHDALADSRERLRESEERFRDFAGSVADWFWEIDLDQRFTFFAGEPDIPGGNPGTMIGRTPREILTARGVDGAVFDRIAAHIARGEAFRDIEYALPDPRLGQIWISSSGRPMRDAAGRIVGYRGASSDVTARHRSEDALRESKEAAELASRSKTEFLANMSHELRTPLNAIIGFSEIMREELFGPIGSERYRDYVDGIHESGQYLLDLIRDILDVSRIEAGRMKLEEEQVELPALVDSTLRLVGERARQAGIEVEVALEPKLPPVRGDLQRLKQVLLNLLSNAVKFTPPGGRVRIEVVRDGGITIRIADTGIGMSEQDIDTAFEAFGQVENHLTRTHAGAGLGLPLTKALVEQHDGRIALQSTVGQGTVVTVNLPPERIAT